MRGYGARPPRAKQARFADDGDEDPEATETQRNGIKTDADGDGLNARQRQMLKNNQLVAPMRISAAVPRIVPYALQTACIEVLAHPRILPLDEDLRWEFEKVVQKSDDEFTRIDPLISISKTLSTGTCNIYLKEVVPISRLLVARALHASYALQLTARIKLEPEPYEDNEMDVKPWRREANAASAKYAAFGLAELDLEGLVSDPELLDQVDAHMISLGPLKPREVCAPEWLEEQQDQVNALLRGERVAMKPKPKTGHL